MPDMLKTTIKFVMEEITASYFPPEFVIAPRATVEIGDGDRYEAMDADFTAFVGFNGDIKGGMSLAAPVNVTLKLASALAGEELLKFDDMASDAFGELANIIAGAVKGKLSEGDLYKINLTQPIVTKGNDHKYNTSMNSTKQFFTVGSAPFFVEVFH
jgi:chemotaxis protein CheX